MLLLCHDFLGNLVIEPLLYSIFLTVIFILIALAHRHNPKNFSQARLMQPD